MQAFFDRLLGTSKHASPMVGMVLLSAKCEAWMRRHPETGILHVVARLLALVEVERALGSRGASVQDARAVVDQLLDELPDTGRESEPPFAAALDAVVVSSRQRGDDAMGAFIGALADALPAEIHFLRAPLAASASELAEAFGGSIARRTSGNTQELTLEGWTEDAKTVVAMAQLHSDAKWKNWTIGPRHVFIAVLGYKKMFAALKARGVDPLALIRELSAALPVEHWARERPEGFTPRIGAAGYALLVRAERYAADDRSDVRLRDVLAALHDETELAPWIERLV
ncbi:MAG TPA: hypothetical protein VIF62_23895 [Labilithrix sp.]